MTKGNIWMPDRQTRQLLNGLLHRTPTKPRPGKLSLLAWYVFALPLLGWIGYQTIQAFDAKDGMMALAYMFALVIVSGIVRSLHPTRLQ